MLGRQGVQIVLRRYLAAHDNRVTGHRGSKRPSQRNHWQGPPGRRHNRKLNQFNEWCYEQGLLHCVRNDYR